ncbi:MAG TPA: hypothetical protein PKG65_09585, partial [Ferruginibacter sp.]|nr:hypothetical protein [Ferruginibacter sp.]
DRGQSTATKIILENNYAQPQKWMRHFAGKLRQYWHTQKQSFFEKKYPPPPATFELLKPW